MSTGDDVTTSWRDLSATRVLGSAFSWSSLALALSLLFLAASELAALGDFCARGGPFEVAVECTDSIVIFAPGSILGGLVTVFTGALLAQGSGTAVLAFAWPAPFTSLAVTFLTTFVVSNDVTGLNIGVLFAAMGLAPLMVLP